MAAKTPSNLLGTPSPIAPRPLSCRYAALVPSSASHQSCSIRAAASTFVRWVHLRALGTQRTRARVASCPGALRPNAAAPLACGPAGHPCALAASLLLLLLVCYIYVTWYA